MTESAVLIERIVYTASLATDPRAIDPILDPLRQISARIDPSHPLADKDRTVLLGVQRRLEAYLVEQESLRYFTPDSLQLQIKEHEQGENKKTRLQMYSVVLITAFSAVAVSALPFLDGLQQRVLAGGAVAFSLVHLGAAWLFLTALPAFRSSLRRAFMIICLAVTLLGVGLLAHPIMEIFGLRDHPAASLVYPIPTLVAAMCFHFGNIVYVRLLGFKNFWSTIWPYVIGAVGLSAVTWFLPHSPTSEPELTHDISAVIWALILLTPVASAIILPAAKRRLPEIYKPSMRHLFQAMFPIIAVSLYQYIVRVTAGPYMSGAVAYILFSMVFVMGLMLLRAGYSFNKVSRY